jgi:phosphohistidine phosphatase
VTLELLIVRHGIAYPRDAKRWPDDGRRPLTAEGARRARRAAAGLKRIARQPDLVLTSPLVRARDTAAIFTQSAGWPGAVDCDALTPGRDPQEVLEALRRNPAAKAERVAVVGHQPHLGRLLALCLRGDARCEAFELKKSAVVCVRFEGPPRPRQGALAWSLAPRILRRLA